MLEKSHAVPQSKPHLPVDTKKKQLFRQQAIEQIASKQYGTVILAQPISHSFITVLFSIIAICIIAFIICFDTTKKAYGRGVLLPTSGELRIFSSQTGLVTERLVREGQRVRKGDVLFIVSSERNSGGIESADENISNILTARKESLTLEVDIVAAQSDKKITALSRQVTMLEDQITSSESKLALQERRVMVQMQSYDRYQSLAEKNYISAAQLQERQVELLDQQNQLVEKKQEIGLNKRNLADAMAEVENLKLVAQRDRHVLIREIKSIEQDLVEISIRKTMHVRAPKDGVVTAIVAEVGQTINANSSLATILPNEAKLAGEIHVSSRSIGFIKPGMPVLLRYQAFPYQKFGQYKAMVKEISNTALSPGELGISGNFSSVNSNEPLYRIRLELESQHVLAYGKEVPLKSGMQMDATVSLDHRRLYEWIFEPIYSITGKN